MPLVTPYILTLLFPTLDTAGQDAVWFENKGQFRKYKVQFLKFFEQEWLSSIEMQPFIRDGMKSIVWKVSCESQVLAIMKASIKPLINGLSVYALELAGLIKAYNV